MITRDELWELLGRRPFQPFRVTLMGGDTVDVTRTAQAITTSRQFIVGTPDDRFRWIQLEKIDRVEVFGLMQPT